MAQQLLKPRARRGGLRPGLFISDLRRTGMTTFSWQIGFVEGLNNKIGVIQRRAYGLHDEEYLKLKILTCTLPTL
jgi:Transposase